MELSSHSNSRRSITYFEQLKALNAARKSARPSATSAKSRECPVEADDARASLTAFAATVTHSEHPRGSVRHHIQEMRRSTINETINKSVNQSDLWENFRVTERDQRHAGRPEAHAFVFGGQAPATDPAKKPTI